MLIMNPIELTGNIKGLISYFFISTAHQKNKHHIIYGDGIICDKDDVLIYDFESEDKRKTIENEFIIRSKRHNKTNYLSGKDYNSLLVYIVLEESEYNLNQDELDKRFDNLFKKIYVEYMNFCKAYNQVGMICPHLEQYGNEAFDSPHLHFLYTNKNIGENQLFDYFYKTLSNDITDDV